jgi:hypothetical protein
MGTAITNLTIVKENRNNSINRLRCWRKQGSVTIEVEWKETGARAGFDIMSETRPNLEHQLIFR